MKKTILGTVICLGGLIAMAAQPAAAQMVDTLKVDLPYAATVNGVTLPAGEYTIRPVWNNGGAPVVQISGNNGKNVFAIVTPLTTPNDNPANETRVELKQDGEHYKIQSVWIQGEDTGYEFD